MRAMSVHVEVTKSSAERTLVPEGRADNVRMKI
jgi:hypothetical protein